MSLAEELARAALRGWFGDPDGFKNMQEGNNKKAAREVNKILSERLPFTEHQPMKLWTRFKRIFHYDWGICCTCNKTIPSSSWSCFDNQERKWYCLTCAVKLPDSVRADRRVTGFDADHKDHMIREEHDAYVWVIIFIVGILLVTWATVIVHWHH